MATTLSRRGPSAHRPGGGVPPAAGGVAPGVRRWWVLVVLCTSLLVVSLDNTILNVALPSIARDFHASSSELQWIVDAYAVVFAGLLLVLGSVGDHVGRKRRLPGRSGRLRPGVGPVGLLGLS